MRPGEGQKWKDHAVTAAPLPFHTATAYTSHVSNPPPRIAPEPGAIGFDWVAAIQGGVSRLISWPRKKLITKQLPNRSFLSQPDSGCASLRIPARGADRWTQILAGIGSPSATADARLRCGLALDGLVRRTSPSRHNQRTTHVEALGQEQQDGGSIPPASTQATLQTTAKWLFHWFFAFFLAKQVG